MLTRLRTHFGTAGLIVAIVALVAALGGSAIAASGALTGKQKKEVKTIAKQYAGKPGAAGAAGPQGAAGAKGDAGAKGANGTNGTNGTNGKSVEVGTATGAECEQGGATVQVAGEASTKKHICNGSPWTADGMLPSGKTETGVWGEVNLTASTASYVEKLSFNIPLPAPPTVNIIDGSGTALLGNASKCPGTAAEPQASDGSLCLYIDPSASTPTPFTSAPIGVFLESAYGVVLNPTMEAFNFVSGTWAVTAS